MIITKNPDGYITDAETEDFSWWFGTKNDLKCRATGYTIYQMRYVRGGKFDSEPVPDEVKVKAKAFLIELETKLQKAEEERVAKIKANQPKLIHDEAKAIAYDNLHNEGVRGGGYNPYRPADVS